MHKIDRRKLMVSGAIEAAALTVAAVPTIGLATSLKAAPGKDRLFDLIELYKTQTKDLHEQCRKRDMDDLWLTCAAPTSPLHSGVSASAPPTTLALAHFRTTP
jgi:hypothetical protein